MPRYCRFVRDDGGPRRRDIGSFAVAVAAVAVVSALDYVTGIEIRLFPLYFVPVAFVSSRSSRGAGIALATLCTVAWGLANHPSVFRYSRSYIWPINLASMFIAFATVALLVTEVHRRLLAEQRLSRHDALTGLHNSRAFYEDGERLLALARRSARPLTLAFIDLDNFKSINDDHGHQAGDTALKAVAAELNKQVRGSDLVSRLGGDEFAVLLVDTAPTAAGAALERVREGIATAMKLGGWSATASIGAVGYRKAPASLREAVRAADTLMYGVKTEGKNRVTIESIEPEIAG